MEEKNVKQITTIELARGNIEVRRAGVLGITVGIIDPYKIRYITATTRDVEEIRSLYYFLKPIVIETLELEESWYKEAIEENIKNIEQAEREQKSIVWDIWDRDAFGRRTDKPLVEAKELVEKQKQKLKEIQEELENLTK